MKRRRIARGRGWVVLLALGSQGCIDPPQEALVSSGMLSSTDASTTGGELTSGSSSSAKPLDGSSGGGGSSDGTSTGGSSSGDEGDSDGTSGSSSDTGEPLPECGDGVIVAGELCHALGSPIAVNPAPARLALGDLDLDGAVDILIANSGSPEIQVLYGVGDGNFVAPQLLLTAAANVHDLVLDDLSGDGWLDLVITAQAAGQLVSYANDGAGALFFAGLFPAEILPGRLVTGDVTGDGIPDAVVTGTTAAALLRGNGLAGFIVEQSPLPLPNGIHFPGLRDLDGDGQLDLLSVNSSGNNISVLRNLGGTLAEPDTAETSNTPAGLAAGDVDGDGDLDVMVIHTSTDRYGLLLGDGLGALGAEQLTEVMDDPRSLALADLDQDGHLDVVTAHSSPGLLAVELGVGDGTFAAAATFALEAPVDLHVAELNGDEVPDLVATQVASSGVQVLLSNP